MQRRGWRREEVKEVVEVVEGLVEGISGLFGGWDGQEKRLARWSQPRCLSIRIRRWRSGARRNVSVRAWEGKVWRYFWRVQPQRRRASLSHPTPNRPSTVQEWMRFAVVQILYTRQI